MDISHTRSEKNSGFFLVDKPSGPTSHDIIDRLRRITGIRKIGHAGTLDPFASGLLIVAIGREATREISRFVKMDKEYIATLHLGAISDTYDRTGTISVSPDALRLPPEKERFEEILKKFTGRQQQIPPMYSAKKVKGKKLYELARKGIEIERKPAEIEVYSIELEEFDLAFPVLRISCSSGTYIRSLAHDIGEAMGIGAYLEELVRTKIGPYSNEKAIDPDNLDADNFSSMIVPAHLFFDK